MDIVDCIVTLDVHPEIDVHDKLHKVHADMTLFEFQQFLYYRYMEPYFDSPPNITLLCNDRPILPTTNFGTIYSLFEDNQLEPIRISLYHAETKPWWTWIGQFFGF